jgi:uncharacterized membrane protein YhfC
MLTAIFSLNFLGMIALPILLAFYFTRKFKLAWSLVLAGALTFIAAQVFHIPFLRALTNLFNDSGFSASSETLRTVITAVVLGLAAGVFEETARFILFKFRLKDVKTWNEGVLVGVGHGGVGSMLLGIFGALTLINMVIMRNGDLSNFNIPADEIDITRQQIESFWATPAYIAILELVERVFAMCLHLTLSVMVLYSVVYQKPVWFWAALLWHAFWDASAVYLRSIVGALAVEGVVGALAVISLWILFTMRTWFVEVEPAQAVIEA